MAYLFPRTACAALSAVALLPNIPVSRFLHQYPRMGTIISSALARTIAVGYSRPRTYGIDVRYRFRAR